MTSDKSHKIGLGAVQFGLDYGISNQFGITRIEEVNAILELATNHHIGLIDTAYSYGISEKILGETKWLGHFEVISKFPSPLENETIGSFFNESLTRLKKKSLYAYMAHSADELINNNNLWGQLIKLKDSGLVKRIGYSLYTPNQLDQLLSLKMVPDIVQIPYNLFDRRFEVYFEPLNSLGVEIHTRSTFLQGLFFTNIDLLPAFFEPAKEKIKHLQNVIPSKNALAGALLNFCISNDYIHKVIIGVNNHVQLNDNLDQMKNSLPQEIKDDFSVEEEQILLPYLWPVK